MKTYELTPEGELVVVETVPGAGRDGADGERRSIIAASQIDAHCRDAGLLADIKANASAAVRGYVAAALKAAAK